jgi:mannitol/fructose-specific phosphotransferase system IIA component (Ntr-type)
MTASTESQASPLRRLIGPETVRAKVTVDSWEEAVESVGALLVAAGKARAGYTEAMERVLKEMGPYAVIAPGIVLLHARPEDGVLQPCLGLITLSTAVPFGHSENDPVDLVFALGAVDKEAHIASLKVLAEMLGDQDVLLKIRSAMTDSDLASIFIGKA